MSKTNNICKFIKQYKIETIVLIYILIVLITGLLLQPFDELIIGLKNIINAPGVLISDYMVIGGIGPALVNASLVALTGYLILVINNMNFIGISIASIFTLMGFGLLGKNIFSIFPLILGVYFYSKFKKDSFDNYVYIALFSTTLSPFVTQSIFGFGWSPVVGVSLGIIAGILVAPMANFTVIFHKGYCLYNVGFAAGLTGFFIMSILRGFGYESTSVSIWGTEFDSFIKPFIIILSLSMIILGLVLGEYKKRNHRNIIKTTGIPLTDYVTEAGFSETLVNMGLVGLIGVLYIILVGSSFNGPTLGGIFTMMGFAAYGKHPLNVIPIMFGVWLGTVLSVYDTLAPGSMLAALFGTALAPITGRYGSLAGILAGYIHLHIVSVVGSLHGGLNLYNNGFAAGFVALFFVSLMRGIKETEDV